MPEQENQTVEWIRAQVAADKVGVDRRTIRSWSDRSDIRIRHKTLPTGERRYHSGDVEQLARAMEDGAAPEQAAS